MIENNLNPEEQNDTHNNENNNENDKQKNNSSPEKDVKAYLLESKNECMLNPLCYDIDDEKLGQRFPGGFVKAIYDNDHPCLLTTYDNGDLYLYDQVDKELFHLGKMKQSKLIHKYLEKVIYDCADYNKIEVPRPFYCAENEIDCTSFIRLIIDQNNMVVYLTNIFIPFEKKHRNIGKDLLSEIYRVCQTYGFRLILLDVVESFKEKLRARNAQVNDYEDSVEITPETNLKSRFKIDKKD